MQVKVRGKNLKDVITAIKPRKAEYMHDYYPGEYQRPQPDEPIIESIEVNWRDPMTAARDGQRGQGEPKSGATSGARLFRHTSLTCVN